MLYNLFAPPPRLSFAQRALHEANLTKTGTTHSRHGHPAPTNKTAASLHILRLACVSSVLARFKGNSITCPLNVLVGPTLVLIQESKRPLQRHPRRRPPNLPSGWCELQGRGIVSLHLEALGRWGLGQGPSRSRTSGRAHHEIDLDHVARGLAENGCAHLPPCQTGFRLVQKLGTRLGLNNLAQAGAARQTTDPQKLPTQGG